MMHRTLLDMFGDIDDDFIEEAANPELFLKTVRKSKWTTILPVRKLGMLAACMVVAVGLIVAVPHIKSVDINKNDHIPVSSNHSSGTPSMMEASQDSINKGSEDIALPTATSMAITTTTPGLTTQTTDMSIAFTTVPPMFKFYTDGILSFQYLDGKLYTLIVDDGATLTDLTIPAEIDGKTITEIHTDFWNFSSLHSDVKTITIPATVQTFGNIDALNPSIHIFCPTGSPAEKFFKENGFTVHTT